MAKKKTTQTSNEASAEAAMSHITEAPIVRTLDPIEETKNEKVEKPDDNWERGPVDEPVDIEEEATKDLEEEVSETVGGDPLDHWPHAKPSHNDMTLEQYYAGEALSGLLSNTALVRDLVKMDKELIAQAAKALAHEMVKEEKND